jgi:hypothetical protein
MYPRYFCSVQKTEEIERERINSASTNLSLLGIRLESRVESQPCSMSHLNLRRLKLFLKLVCLLDIQPITYANQTIHV